MSHSSLYLTNLYNDLITNTPQTITMDIPSEVGQGQISQTKNQARRYPLRLENVLSIRYECAGSC